MLLGTLAAVFAPVQHLPVAMLPLAALVWAAARLGMRTAAVQVCLAGLVALTATTQGWGPYAVAAGADASNIVVQASLAHVFVLISLVVTLALATSTEERVQALDRADRLALHDALTGLPNRRLLSDRLEQARNALLRDGTPATLWLLDLDGFKAVNDDFGHDAGDAVLLAVSARLRAAVRSSDTVARLGGDEFVVLCPGVALCSGRRAEIEQRLRAAVCAPIRFGPARLQVASSLGAAGLQVHHSEADVLREADTAMYAEKAARRPDAPPVVPAGALPGARGSDPGHWSTARHPVTHR